MTAPTIQAIQTRYNGRFFRSRLEARWAVYFDAMEIPYIYEHQSFVSKAGVAYLPDFYFPSFDTYAEIKPGNFTIEAIRKAQIVPPHCLLISGAPSADVALFPDAFCNDLAHLFAYPDEYSGELIGDAGERVVSDDDYLRYVNPPYDDEIGRTHMFINLQYSHGKGRPYYDFGEGQKEYLTEDHISAVSAALSERFGT